MNKTQYQKIIDRIKELTNKEKLERYKHLIHIRSARQALAEPIEPALDEEILIYEEELRKIMEENDKKTILINETGKKSYNQALIDIISLLKEAK